MDKNDVKIELRHNLLTNLIALGQADTLYRDLYLMRARYCFAQEFSPQDYLELKQLQTKEANLPNQIRNAMLRSDWHEVHELTGLSTRLQEGRARNLSLVGFARKIYDNQETPIDPFSPGMHKIAGFSVSRLADLHQEVLRILKQLAQTDKEWAAFYTQRLAAFTNLTIDTESQDESAAPASAQVMEEEAAQALQSGNMLRLEQLAKKLMQATDSQEKPIKTADFIGDGPKPEADYRYEFPQETLKSAAALGLEHFSVPSRSAEYAPLCRFAWHPTYSVMNGPHSSVLRVPDLALPQGLPEAQKSRIQLFAMHPFINSAGVRFLPMMAAEDVLVEGFPEPEAGSVLPTSGLLEALGIKQRNQLSRQKVESLLMEKGNDVLRNELGLDPREFKLVCIPPDLHLRIGQKHGWGQQKIWTHFDGYMIMADASRRALAGGDVRYGGIYDLLGLSNSYDSERIILRFAVVQRRRLAIWQ